MDWRWLATSICLILLSNVGRALRWQVMLRPFGHPISVWRLTSDTAIGLTAGVLLGRVGEVVRPYLIAVQTGLPFSSQAAAWLLERMLAIGHGLVPDSFSILFELHSALGYLKPGTIRGSSRPAHGQNRRIKMSSSRGALQWMFHYG